MKVRLNIAEQPYQADLHAPLDISMPLVPGALVPNAWYAPPFEVTPVRAGDFIGSVAAGGAVNFMNVRLNPHGNGTHTESVAHVLAAGPSIHQTLSLSHLSARLISLYPQASDAGRVLTREQLAEVLTPHEVAALIIRTLPNDERKLTMNYSGTHPPYLHPAAAELLIEYGIQHLLIDLPSVDPEEDAGRLSAHKLFWQVDGQRRDAATITELVYVNQSIADGLYLLNLQVPPFELDAAPSRPVLYALRPISEPPDHP